MYKNSFKSVKLKIDGHARFPNHPPLQNFRRPPLLYPGAKKHLDAIRRPSIDAASAAFQADAIILLNELDR